MPTNNSLGTPQPIPSIPNFSPGDDAVYLRQQDGHLLGHNGIDGANCHDPNAPREDLSATPQLDVDD